MGVSEKNVLWKKDKACRKRRTMTEDLADLAQAWEDENYDTSEAGEDEGDNTAGSVSAGVPSIKR